MSPIPEVGKGKIVKRPFAYTLYQHLPGETERNPKNLGMTAATLEEPDCLRSAVPDLVTIVLK